MGTESWTPLDELKFLDGRVDHVPDLDGLKPIFLRLDEIGREHSGDFEIQLAVTEIKQRVVDRGKLLKHSPPTLRMPAPDLDSPAPRTTDPPTIRMPAPNIPSSAAPFPSPSQTSAPAGDSSVPEQRLHPIPPIPAPSAQPPFAQTLLGSEPLSTTGSIAATPPVPAAFQPPPAPPEAGAPPPPPQRGGPPLPPPNTPQSWKRPLVVGAIAGAVIAILLIGFLVNQARKKTLATAPVHIQVTTTPPGASVRINGEPKCNSNCTVDLAPGVYQLTAFLDGYEPSASNVTVSPGKPASVNLPLEPQAQVVRILTDLDQGKVAFDDQPAADLQDGQFVIEKVPAGTHTVKVTSRTGEATFTVEITDAKQPVVMGPIAARNLLAVIVASLGNSARVFTNNGALKLALNGQAQADATPTGVDLTNFQPGVAELSVGEGKEQHSMKESFSPAPTLTAFLKSDLNIGTLIVSAGEDDARVFVNNKEYPRKTQKGQVRIQTIGAVNVRVAKDGYEPVAVQTAEVKKGSEVRLEFKLQPVPKMSALQIRGATPGATILLDQKPLGVVGDDGAFTNSAVPPGDHLVEISKDQFVARRFQRPFRAGQPVALTGADVVLAAALGSVRLTRAPADIAVVYRRADETQNQEARGNQLDLPPGTYVFTARAPGFTEKSERVQVAAGGNHTVELALARVAPPPPPPPKIAGMADFENAGEWKKDGETYAHKGGGFLQFKLQPKGTFNFTVELLHGGNIFRGGKLRWAFQYQDARNYDLFELDQRYLWSKVIIAGKTYERGKYDHNLTDKDKSYAIQVDVSADKLVHKVMNGNEWTVVDSWSEPGRNFTEGKFGFLVQGNDEIGVSGFKFVAH